MTLLSENEDDGVKITLTPKVKRNNRDEKRLNDSIHDIRSFPHRLMQIPDF